MENAIREEMPRDVREPPGAAQGEPRAGRGAGARERGA